ncbi:MAG: hypothetical protein ACOX1Q_11160 [Eubacteriales bacterium]
MDLVNKYVQHKVFGRGTICELSEEIISVEFKSGVKKFVYPDAFRGFLVMTEKKSRQYVEKILGDIDMEQKLQREKEILEEKKRERLANLPTNTKAQVAFGFIENEKQSVLDSWEIFIGTYRSGENKGKPRSSSRIYPNSACLLTQRKNGEPEENREIWGVFMVKDDFLGADHDDGIIPAHEKYRIVLGDDSKPLKYWDYFKEKSAGKSVKWGSVEVKYFDNFTMARILTDMIECIKNEEQKQQCDEFIEYFCKLNRIDRNQIVATS